MSKPKGGVVTDREYRGYGTYKRPTYQINGSNMWVSQPLLKGVYARTTVLDGGDFAKMADAYGYININEGVEIKDANTYKCAMAILAYRRRFGQCRRVTTVYRRKRLKDKDNYLSSRFDKT